MIDLSKKHVFIAGGSRGIGAAAAVMAAKAGADVSLTYHSNADAAAKVVAEITALGKNALAIRADISVDGDAQSAVDAAVAKFGPLDGVVVSAGVFEGKSLDDMDLAFWNRQLAINLTGTFLTVKAAVGSLRQARGGSIVIYTSTAGQRGSDIFSAYATTKGGQILFMRSMARELAPDKIRVNCVAPAWTETDMAAPSLDELGRADVAKSFPLGRIGLPDDVAGATIYLLSDLAKFVTGTTMTVDGGMDMRG